MPSVVGERRRVFHQFELQKIDEETNRSVIVVNDESDEFQLRHLHSASKVEDATVGAKGERVAVERSRTLARQYPEERIIERR